MMTVELKRDWWVGYSKIGDAYLGLRKYQEAIDAYKKGLECDPKNIGLRRNLGTGATNADQFEVAIKYQSNAIKLAPENHLLYSDRSLSNYSLKKYEQALEDAMKTVELKPDWWLGYCRMGDAYNGLRKYQEAIDAYKKGLECDPKNIGLRGNLGTAASNAGQFEVAIKYQSDAIKLAPENHLLYSDRSLSYISLEKYEHALEDAMKTVELKPDWWVGYGTMGDAYRGLGKYQEAIDAYKKGLECDPKNIELRGNLGIAASHAGQFEVAIKYESDAIKLAPEDHKLYSNRSSSYWCLKKYEQALEDAMKTVELKPDNWVGYFRMGYAYHELGKYQEAIDAYKKALDIQPGSHTMFYKLSLAYSSLQHYEQALEYAKESVKLKPDWGEGYRRLGESYYGLGKQEEAIHAYKKGVECDPKNRRLQLHLVASTSKSGGRSIISHVHGVVLKAFQRSFWGASHQINEGDKTFCNTSFDSVYTDFKESFGESEKDLLTVITMVTLEELNGVRVATQLNEYIYELYKPTKKPDMDIILVHGLQLDGIGNLHLSTWLSGDVGSYHAWPKTWLEDFPHARVLTVAYDSHFYQTAQQGRIDLHNTAENLMNCLLLLEDGDAPSCRPLVFVGYSFGGILIKQLCLHAFRNIFGYHEPQLKLFLNRIKAIYFMGTPHLGMIHEDFGLAVQENASPLFKDVELLNHTLARLHAEFDRLRRACAWQVSSIGESNKTRWGILQTLLVPEVSARYGESFSTVQADHISLPKPTAKTSLVYGQLEQLIKQAYKGKSRRFN